MIRTNKEWRAKQLTESLNFNGVANKISALSLSIMALGLMTVSKVNANDVPLPIKHITLNNENQIVVYFGKRDGEFPSPPHLLDTPGPNHRIVIEFADATVDKVNMPGAADLSTKLHKQLSAIKSIRYQTITTGDTVKAQVVIEVPELLKVRPRVVKLEEEAVTINLGDDIVEQSAALDEPSGRRTQSPQSMETAGANSVIAQKESVTEIPVASNSEPVAAVDEVVSSTKTKVTKDAAVSPDTVPVVSTSSVSDTESAPANVADSSAPALRTEPLTVAADGAAVAAASVGSTTTSTSASTTKADAPAIVESETTSQLAESMPTSPKSKPAAPTSPIKMPETLTNAGANLKKMMHWPHKDDAASTTPTKEASNSKSADKKAVAETKKDAAETKKEAAETKKEAAETKKVAETKKNTADVKDDTAASKSGKLGFLSKLPRPAFAKSKNDKATDVASSSAKKTANTVVESGASTTDTTVAGTSDTTTKVASTVEAVQPAASQIPGADQPIGDAPPAGAEFSAAFSNDQSTAAVKAPSSVASAVESVTTSPSASAKSVSSSATSAGAGSTTSGATSDSPAPGSWDWTATQSAAKTKQTAVATKTVETGSSASDVAVIKSESTTTADQAEPTRPVKVAQADVDDGRPKISTPIETTETHTFSEPAQMLTTGTGTQVTPGAQGMMNIKAKESEVKPVTVAETEKSTFADALRVSPTKKAAKVDVSAASEPALIRDTEMTDPAAAVEQTATKPAVEAEPQATEIPTQSAEMTTPAVQPGEVESTTTEDKNKLALANYNRAVKAHLAGKLPEAIASYKEALEGNPELAEAHSNLGLIYNQQHHYEQAVSEFQKALAINPKDAITYNGIGAALRAQRDLNGAIKNWQTAVTLDPKLATAHYNLGVAYELQRDYDKSLVSYEQAIKCDYRLGEAYYRMGMILEKRHRNEDARVKFKAALKASENADYSADARQRLALLESNKTIK